MASSVKASDLPGELHADKIVIVTGPTFGAAMKFIVLGAVLGAGAALYWKSRQESAAMPPTVAEEEIESRVARLAARAKSIANRTRDLVQHAAEIAGPALQRAIAEGKSAAHQVEAEIKANLHEDKEEPGTPEQV